MGRVDPWPGYRTHAHNRTHAQVGDLESRSRRRSGGGALLFLALSAGTALLLVALPDLGLIVALTAGLITAAGFVLVWLWHAPVRGLYVLFGAAVAVTLYPNAAAAPPVYLGQLVPFFSDINTIFHTRLMALSPADLFFILFFLIWLLYKIARGNVRIMLGPLMWPMGLYMVMAVVATVHGYFVAHDMTHALWELRVQLYLFLSYILACSLIKDRGHVHALLWILIMGTGEISIEGALLYVLKIRNVGVGFNQLYSHEQAFFFNAILTLAMILFVYAGPSRMRWAVSLFLPFVLVADFADNRRTGVLAISVAIVVLLLVTAIANEKLRRLAVVLLVALAVLFPPYYLAFKGRAGTLAMPARAIASISNSSPRDASSDQERVGENQDIMASVRSSLLLGNGFGVRMGYGAYPLKDIEKLYPNEPYLPHDSVLWVWMRMGLLGFALFWFLVGTAVVQGLAVMRNARDRWTQGLALFAVLMVLQEVIFGYLDMQWTLQRNMIAVGVLMGLISVLRMSQRTTEQRQPAAQVPHPAGKRRRKTWDRYRGRHHRLLTVKAGRLRPESEGSR